MQKYFLLLLLFFTFKLHAMTDYQNYQTTPNEVYSQLHLINQEINILKQHFNVTGKATSNKVNTELFPRHMWQKTYEILLKINLLREKHNLPYLAVSSREPHKNPPPIIVYEQLLRIRTELDIIKYFLEIPKIELSSKKFNNIKVVDSFNFANDISAELDLLVGKSITPSFVFAQTMRISEDIGFILSAIDITEDTIPPPKKPDAIPRDAYETAQRLMKEVARIQRIRGVASIDFKTLKPTGEIKPDDVFSMTGIILAELQTIKAYLGLKHALTPVAKRYTNIEPADVEQMLGWCIRKMQLIDLIK